MFVKESSWGILIVKGSNGDMFHKKVKFEEQFWSRILGKLERVFDSCLPTSLTRSCANDLLGNLVVLYVLQCTCIFSLLEMVRNNSISNFAC